MIEANPTGDPMVITKSSTQYNLIHARRLATPECSAKYVPVVVFACVPTRRSTDPVSARGVPIPETLHFESSAYVCPRERDGLVRCKRTREITIAAQIVQTSPLMYHLLQALLMYDHSATLLAHDLTVEDVHD